MTPEQRALLAAQYPAHTFADHGTHIVATPERRPTTDEVLREAFRRLGFHYVRSAEVEAALERA
ncbi:MAG TPA: hypothetical protein PKV96_02490 [Candidatus Saccharimonas sp.]|nr:hypothetical protein [Candidatus Saccharimonas sp.]